MANVQTMTPEYQSGFAAYKKGVPYASQPYALDAGKNMLWHRGWQAGEQAAKVPNVTKGVTNVQAPAQWNASSSNMVVSGASSSDTGSGAVVSGGSATIVGAPSVVSATVSGGSSDGTVTSGGTETILSSGNNSLPDNSSGVALDADSGSVHSGRTSATVISGGSVFRSIVRPNLPSSQTTQVTRPETVSSGGTMQQMNIFDEAAKLPVSDQATLNAVKNVMSQFLAQRAVDDASSQLVTALANAGLRIIKA